MRIPRSHTSCGAFIEECTVALLERNFPNISLNPVTG